MYRKMSGLDMTGSRVLGSRENIYFYNNYTQSSKKLRRVLFTPRQNHTLMAESKNAGLNKCRKIVSTYAEPYIHGFRAPGAVDMLLPFVAK